MNVEIAKKLTGRFLVIRFWEHARTDVIAAGLEPTAMLDFCAQSNLVCMAGVANRQRTSIGEQLATGVLSAVSEDFRRLFNNFKFVYLN